MSKTPHSPQVDPKASVDYPTTAQARVPPSRGSVWWALGACFCGLVACGDDIGNAESADASAVDSGGADAGTVLDAGAEVGQDDTGPDGAAGTDAADTASQLDSAADTANADAAKADAAPQCTDAAQCPAADKPCELAACIVGECTIVSVQDGQKCDDNEPCTTDDRCVAGACKSGANKCPCAVAKDCVKHEDGDPCTGTYYCDKSAAAPKCAINPASLITCPTNNDTACLQNGCQTGTGKCAMKAQKDGTACSDGDDCTKDDACAAGACKVGKAVCDCHVDADCASADDNNACNGTLRCDNSVFPFVCAVNPASLIACPTAKDTACLVNTCAAKDGTCAQVASNEAGACDDGNPCTDKDACASGVCASTSNQCACAQASDCLAQEDGNACNGTLFCDKSKPAFVCAINPASVVTCTDADDTWCRVNTCDPKTGGCAMANLPTGATCSDDDLCTVGDACAAGACEATGNGCDCESNADCASKENGNLCDGTLFCDKASAPFKCRVDATTPPVCDKSADTACSLATCAPKTGQCAPKPRPDGLPCDADGNVCTASDACVTGTCIAGPNKCKCEKDADCDAFDDQNLCNGALFCDGSGVDKVCAVNPLTVVSCPTGDNSACKVSTCSPATGKCALASVVDGVPCNADNDACTGPDRCVKGGCEAGNALCECTKDADCDVRDDGNPCNGVYYCDTAKAAFKCRIKPGSVIACSAGSGPCGAQVCDPTDGTCKSADVDDNPCDDGEKCTVGDACKNGVCAPGTNKCKCYDDLDCADFYNGGDLCKRGYRCDTESHFCEVDATKPPKACTPTDSVCMLGECNPATGGCSEVPNKAMLGKACDDGDKCTTGDTCGVLFCEPGLPAACTPADGPCLQVLCDANVGCLPPSPVTPDIACDDLNECTLQTKCDAKGACGGGRPRPCSKAGECEIGGCDAQLGCTVVDAPDGATCTDHDACTANDQCSVGLCDGPTETNCNDGNDCTADTCDKTGGCGHKDLGAQIPCSDGDACTPIDVCHKGACRPDSPLDCDTAVPVVVTFDAGSKVGDGWHEAGVELARTAGAWTSMDVLNSDVSDADLETLLPNNGGQITVKFTDDRLFRLVSVRGGFGAGPVTITGVKKTGSVSGQFKHGFAGTVMVLPATYIDLVAATITSANSGGSVNNHNLDDITMLAVPAVAECKLAPACDAQTGKCVSANDKDAAKCDDGDKCTQKDACLAGVCKAGDKDDCDDNNGCTQDSCDKFKGCVHLIIPKCASCKAASDCGDSTPCASYLCAKGACLLTKLAEGSACVDDDPCTAKTVCTGGACKSKTEPCDDGSVCTLDACQHGSCLHSATNDGQFCGGSGSLNKCAAGSCGKCSLWLKALTGTQTGSAAAIEALAPLASSGGVVRYGVAGSGNAGAGVGWLAAVTSAGAVTHEHAVKSPQKWLGIATVAQRALLVGIEPGDGLGSAGSSIATEVQWSSGAITTIKSTDVSEKSGVIELVAVAAVDDSTIKWATVGGLRTKDAPFIAGVIRQFKADAKPAGSYTTKGNGANFLATAPIPKGFVVVGTVEVAVGGAWHDYVGRFDHQLQPLWAFKYAPPPSGEPGKGVDQATLAGVAVHGETEITAAGSVLRFGKSGPVATPTVRRLDAGTGKTRWVKNLTAFAGGTANGVAPFSDGSAVIAGTAPRGKLNSAFAARFDTSGNQLWNRTYPGVLPVVGTLGKDVPTHASSVMVVGDHVIIGGAWSSGAVVKGLLIRADSMGRYLCP